MRGLEAIERRVEARLAAAMPDVDLLELALAGGRKARMLRLVVDHPDGVDHDLCVAVTRALEEDGLLDEYGVEVWSPGPEPPLRTREHFRRAVGRRVRVHAAAPGGGRSHTGTLMAADDDGVRIATPQGVAEVPYAGIRRARALEDAEASR
jgi:ribosome maturation factor RimP